MKAMTARRKVSVIVLATLVTAVALFGGASASTSVVDDVQAKEKTPSVQFKHHFDIPQS